MAPSKRSPFPRYFMQLKDPGEGPMNCLKHNLQTIFRDHDLHVELEQGMPGPDAKVGTLYCVDGDSTSLPGFFSLCLDQADLDRIWPTLEKWVFPLMEFRHANHTASIKMDVLPDSSDTASPVTKPSLMRHLEDETKTASPDTASAVSGVDTSSLGKSSYNAPQDTMPFVKRLSINLHQEGPAVKDEFLQKLITYLRDNLGIEVTPVQGSPFGVAQPRTLYWELLHPTAIPAMFQLCLEPDEMVRVRAILDPWLPPLVEFYNESYVMFINDCGLYVPGPRPISMVDVDPSSSEDSDVSAITLASDASALETDIKCPEGIPEVRPWEEGSLEGTLQVKKVGGKAA